MVNWTTLILIDALGFLVGLKSPTGNAGLMRDIYRDSVDGAVAMVWVGQSIDGVNEHSGGPMPDVRLFDAIGNQVTETKKGKSGGLEPGGSWIYQLKRMGGLTFSHAEYLRLDQCGSFVLQA